MALSRARGGVAILSVVALLTLVGCAAPVTETDAGGTVSASPSPSTSQTADTDDGGEGGQTDADGEADPSQSRVRVGPAVDYGGPDGGDQGDAELIADGVWCETIAVFWGGTVPEGVRFTFETALLDRPGLQVRAGACGSAAQNPACLGLTLEADDQNIFCSLTVLPQAEFEDGTGITFAGTLECPTAEVCDAVVARDVDRGPPIKVTAPAELQTDSEQDQDQDQDQENQDQQDQEDEDQEDEDQEDEDQEDEDQDPTPQDQDQG